VAGQDGECGGGRLIVIASGRSKREPVYCPAD
jgi:hypothetical protein